MLGTGDGGVQIPVPVPVPVLVLVLVLALVLAPVLVLPVLPVLPVRPLELQGRCSLATRLMLGARRPGRRNFNGLLRGWKVFDFRIDEIWISGVRG